jgi:2-polyprenyl-6-methoxyphenol hydroxylase-like FAD-dependent oxidoreductase
MRSSTCDVLITGAGPVGMMLASELIRRGISCRIIDKSLEIAQTTKALGIQARTLELLEKTGLAEAMISQGMPVDHVTLHSHRKQLARISFAPSIDSPYPYILMIPQDKTEAILNEHLIRQGVTIERGIELTGLRQIGDGIDVQLRHLNGDEEQVTTHWLIGSDGAHSTIRHLLGMDFPGSSFEESFLLADVSLDNDFPERELMAYLHAGDAIAFFPMLDGQYRVFVAYKPPMNPSGEVTLEEVQHMIDACGPPNVRAHHPTWCSRFQINQRKVKHYRKGRAFLLGDAAHIHSPVGAQGMNTGMQDAFNLAWKLALVISQHAPDSLLDSYEAEREPVGAALLRATKLASRLIWSHNPLVTTLRDKIIPIAAPTKIVQRRIINTIAETSITYRHSPLVAEQQKVLTALHAGDRALDAPIQSAEATEPGRLFELLHDARHVLLIFADGQPSSEANIQCLQTSLNRDFKQIVVSYQINPTMPATDTNKRLDPNAALRHRYGITSTGLILIRPDGYIGFRTSSLAAMTLLDYLTRHFKDMRISDDVT